MLEKIAHFSVARRKLVIAVTVLLVVLSGVFGTGVFSRLSGGGFVPDNSEAERANQILDREFDINTPNVVLLIDGKGKPIDDPAVANVGQQATAELRKQPGVQNVVSPWEAPAIAALRSTDGTKALVTAELKDPEENAERIVASTTEGNSDASVKVGGAEAIREAINTQVSEDLARAESIALPLVLVLLVIVFGGVIAAGVPLIVGLVAILGTFLILFLFTTFTDVSVFSINLVTMMGLGLGIDYSLFIVSRYREEMKRGLAREQAIVKSVVTAGRTVLFSSIAIALSLAALVVFPVYFLRSFAYAGVSVVAIAAASSIIFLPALLAVLGPRIDKLRLIKRKSPEEGSTFWARIARIVMRRPLVVAIATTAVMLILAAPFLNVKWGAIDDRVMPSDAEPHLVANALRTDFANDDSASFTVVMPNVKGQSDAIAGYASEVSKVANVARVDSPVGTFVDGSRTDQPVITQHLEVGDASAMKVILGVESASTAAVNAVNETREIHAPFETLVTGFPAEQADSNDAIRDSLLPAALLLVTGSFLILFLMTGSVVLPVKAILMAALSLTASLGAIVWIFQYGHLSELLNFTPTGSIDHSNVLVMFCIAFGLSMDYEVFLLSRIKEEHDLTGDTHTAVAKGLERTGRLVTAAALLISVVFLAFATSGIAFIKLIGLGLTIAIMVDATIVRGALVPALMRLMGEVNWWAPKPLRKLHNRFGISEAAAK